MGTARIFFLDKRAAAPASMRMPTAPVVFVKAIRPTPLVPLEDDSNRPEFKRRITGRQFDAILAALAPIGAGDGPNAHYARELTATASEAWICAKPCPPDLCHIVVDSLEE